MPIKPKTFSAIDKAGKRFIAFLKFKSIGPHAITQLELKDLIRAGWITKAIINSPVASSYTLTHAKVVDTVTPMSTRKGSLDFLERMMSRYAEKAGTELKTDIAGIVESTIAPFSNREEGRHIYGLIKDPKNWGKYLGEALHGKVDNWRHRWDTIVRTELSRASNWGAVDAILHNNPSTPAEDLEVFKAGPNDDRTCKHCKKFWFDDGGHPKVYKMSDLMASGSNIGRKSAEWEATVDPTHPRCRHLLVQLRIGYGFDEKGNLKYKSKDYKHPIAKS
jgi:hypothetical protein